MTTDKPKEVDNESLDDLINNGSSTIKERSELAEVFDNFDDTKPDEKTGVSNVDKNTKISETEIKCMSQMATLRRFGIVNKKIQLDNDIKNLNMSKEGWNKELKTRVATAGRDATLNAKGGIMGGISRLFSPRE